MTKLLIRLFVPSPDSPEARGRFGLLSCVVGIICNALLCIVKFLIGSLAGSVSIMADSVNNLSDAGASVVTLIGFRVSGKPADEDHPFGHARAEYIGGLIVSFMILLLGVTFLRSSLEKIFHPEEVDLSLPAMILLGISVLVKAWLSSFNRYMGKRIGSAALLATAQDSLNDVISSAAVLVSALISVWTGFSLDGWMGVAVAVFILFAGFGIARDTVGPLLGQKPPEELVSQLEAMVRSYPGILGMHDLLVHSYGPGQMFASVHAEVDAADHLLQSHDLIDNIERDVLSQMGIHLVIHLDPIVIDDPLVNKLRIMANQCVQSLDAGLTMHDFRLVIGETHSNLIFDINVPFGCRLSDQQIVERVSKLVRQYDNRFFPVITIDHGSM